MSTNKISSTEYYVTEFQDNVDSFPRRTNDQLFVDKINGLVDDIASAAIGTTNAETTNARPYHTSLLNRLDSINDNGVSYIKEGGEVVINGSDPQKVDVLAGQGNVDGSDVNWSNTTSGTIAYTSSNTRFDVVVVNNNNTLTVVTGSESANPILPAISQTQKPLCVLEVGTASLSIGWDAREQGAYYMHNGALRWKWKIQDALSDISMNGTDIKLGPGKYYETVVVFANDINIKGFGNVELHNISTYVVFLGDIVTQTNNVTLENLSIYGDDIPGSIALLRAFNVENIVLKNIYFDANLGNNANNEISYEFNNCSYRFDNVRSERYSGKLNLVQQNKKNEEENFYYNADNAVIFKKTFRPVIPDSITIGQNYTDCMYDGYDNIYCVGLVNPDTAIYNISSGTVTNIHTGVQPYSLTTDGYYMYAIGAGGNYAQFKISDYSYTTGSINSLLCNKTAFDGRYIYVGDSTNLRRYTAINIALGSTNIAGFTNISAVILAGSYLYVADRNANTVTPVSVNPLAPSTPLAVGTNPQYLEFDGRYVYVINQTSNNVSIIDTTDNTVLGSTISLSSTSPTHCYFDGRFVYVPNGSLVDVIDPVSLSIVGRSIVVGNATAICGDGNNLYCTSINSITPTSGQLKIIQNHKLRR